MWKNLVGKKLSKLQFKNKLVSSYGLELMARIIELEGGFWYNFVGSTIYKHLNPDYQRLIEEVKELASFKSSSS